MLFMRRTHWTRPYINNVLIQSFTIENYKQNFEYVRSLWHVTMRIILLNSRKV